MNKKFKPFYFILTATVIMFLHLPFAFAKSASRNNSIISAIANPIAESPANDKGLVSVYDSLDLDMKGLSKHAFDAAIKGLEKLSQSGKLDNDKIVTIADFSAPSNRKRLFIIDLEHYKILFNTFVSHGRNTGRETASYFSNRPESFQSSPGFYVTRETYIGKNGYSLRLQGMEAGINDKAMDRGIVMHGAPYVSQAVANAQGWVGRSQGCPAVPIQLASPIINRIKNGSCLFIYHPSYVSKSRILA